MPTFMARPEEVQREWFVIDAAGQPLGRLSTTVATILRGKHKPIYTPNVDTGDYVIVLNAAKVLLTGHKLDQKFYFHHSGYPGGLKRTRYRDLIQRRPEFVIEKAVRGMLPKNRLGRQMFHKLKVYAGAEHPHEGQQPRPWGGK